MLISLFGLGMDLCQLVRTGFSTRSISTTNLGPERDERLPRRDAGEGGRLEVLHEPVHPPPLPLIQQEHIHLKDPLTQLVLDEYATNKPQIGLSN